MGGAADFPQRSSSPLKRPASDLEQEKPLPTEEDVEMDALPPSDPPGMTHNIGQLGGEEEQHRVLQSQEEATTVSTQAEHHMITEEHQPQIVGNNPTPESERKLCS
jgi:hypothetical protein